MAKARSRSSNRASDKGRPPRLAGAHALTSMGSTERVILALLASVALGLSQPARAEPQQSLGILLRQLKAQPIGLYDGMRLFRLPLLNGRSLTLSLSCEREVWRVQAMDEPNGASTFYDAADFLSAKGARKTWLCTAPARHLE